MQDEMVLWVVGVVIAFFIGVVFGILIGKNSKESPATKKVENELGEYKSSVSEHFGKTADLVDDLTNSYKKVFDHLGESAKKLLSEDELNKHLKSRGEKVVTLTYLNNKEDEKK